MEGRPFLIRHADGIADPLTRYCDLVDDPAAFLAASRRPLPRFLWTNPLRTTPDRLAGRLADDGFDPQPLAWHPAAFRVPADREGLGRHWTYLAGHFQIQEASAMVPALLLAPRPGERVLDLCAAPGNKTVQCAVAMANRGTVVGNDLVGGRLSALRSSIDRLGLCNVTVTCHDGVNFPAHTGPFDRVLVDAPCSCEGTSRRHTRVHDEAEPPFARFARKQALLLAQAIRRCRRGGRVVYSTCTYAPEENEAVVDEILARFDGRVRLLPVDLPGLRATPGVTAWQGRTFDAALVRARRIWPHHNDSGGFFIAVLERGGDRDDGAPPPAVADFPPGEGVGRLQRRSADPDAALAVVRDRFGIPPAAFDDLVLLENGARVGFLVAADHRPPSLAEQTGGLKFLHQRPRHPIPTTGAAAAFGPRATRNVVEVTAAQRDAYLSRADFVPTSGQLDACDGTGYVLVQYEESVLGVGFYGAGSGRVASLFPKALMVQQR